MVYQIKWDDTKFKKLVSTRGGFDIHAQEMLGALVAVRLWANKLKYECVAVYNDNPGAAGAIKSKAPPLHRLDMQFMIRELSKLSVNHQFYFWSIKVDGVNNEKADALSRFKPLQKFNIDASQCIMEDKDRTQKIVNEYMDGLINYRLNVHPSIKKWDLTAFDEINAHRAKQGRNPIKPFAMQDEIDYI